MPSTEQERSVSNHSTLRRRVVAAVALCLTCLGSVAYAAVDPPAAVAAGSNSLTVTAREYSYRLSGRPAGGWVTRTQVQDAVAGDVGAAIPAVGTGLAGGIPYLLPPRGAATSIARLDAGRYALLSSLKTPDGTSDAARGMVAIVRVRSEPSDLDPPTKHVVDVTTSDSALTLPDGTLPAHGWARITTTASTPRDFELFRYATPESTLEAATAYYQQFFSSGTAPPGPAPAVIVGNVLSMPPGAVAYYRLALQPDRYVAVSDTPTDSDGSTQLHADFTVE